MSFLFEPIGVVRSPFVERLDAPRQATAPGAEVQARIELLPGRGFEDALEGLELWEYLWVLFVFHRNIQEARGWKPKVQPPRSEQKYGLFATRSPHRPNPIGLSATRLVRIDGLAIDVVGLDVLDGTPVLDLKPYVAYADAHPEAGSGWLAAADPAPSWTVAFGATALEAIGWLSARGVELRPPIEAALALGPQPHAYRRIRAREPDSKVAMTLALKEWRVDFDVEGRTLVVLRIRSGYRAKELAVRVGDANADLHRSFVAAFG